MKIKNTLMSENINEMMNFISIQLDRNVNNIRKENFKHLKFLNCIWSLNIFLKYAHSFFIKLRIFK